MNANAVINIARQQLGMEEDDYRALLLRVGGHASLRAMSERQKIAVVEEMKRLGFAPAARSNGARKPLEGRFAKKLQALWIAGWNLGLVRNRDDRALVEFVKRQTNIDHIRFLRDAGDARKAVEALKGWLARDGGVKWGTSHGYDWLAHDGGKIAWAQYCKLAPGATLIGNRAEFAREVMQLLPEALSAAGPGALKPADWRVVMNAFGERLRKAKP